jgi:hypothetical protein
MPASTSSTTQTAGSSCTAERVTIDTAVNSRVTGRTTATACSAVRGVTGMPMRRQTADSMSVPTTSPTRIPR